MPAPTYIKQIVRTYDKDNLINILNRLQEKEGYLSEDRLRFVSKETGIPLAKLYSTASFYSFLRLKKKGKHTIRICNSPSCYLNGSTNMLNIIKKITRLKPGEYNNKFSFEITQCIGCCDKAPAMMLDDKVYENLTPEKIKAILKKCK